MSDAPGRRPNRLIREKSPYLLQHAYNPVDWHPWGEEAFARARAEDKPIFLSVGYATCHWCHVMERESFENEEIARVMNENFVCVKVDREERIDVDALYMNAVQQMTQHGGWPMSVWLTPEGKPFYGGTYFPPTDQGGRPGFYTILQALARKWREGRAEIEKIGERMRERLAELAAAPAPGGELSGDVVRQAVFHFQNAFDEEWGGFGGAPKFPRPMILALLLRWWRGTGDANVLKAVTVTLDKMADGGIYDHVGGGFARYSVDERWTIPHFEKMLYDNALLAAAYAEAHQATGEERYAAVVREVLAYVLRDMTHPEGGFYSAQDADSEGEEGKFYVWTEREIREVLGPDLAPAFIARFNVTPHGNFEHGTNNPWIARPLEQVAQDLRMSPSDLRLRLDQARNKLFEARSRRVPPLKDDKILTAWNGLMITGFCKAAQALGDAGYAEHARRAADFVGKYLVREGRLLRRWREGEAKYPGYLNDYAFFTQGLLDLYETTFEVSRLAEAIRLTDVLLAEYQDPAGGFYGTGEKNEKLLVRNKDAYDGAIPSGNSIAALNLLRLAELTGERRYEEAAHRAMLAFRENLEKIPTGYPLMLCAVDYYLGERMEVVLSGDLSTPEGRALLEAAHQPYLPNKVLSHASPEAEALLPPVKGKTAQGGRPTAYVCRNHACRLPTTDAAQMKREMGL